MGNVVFNVAKGRANEMARRVKANDPTNSALIIVLLKTVEADAALIDYADLGALLAAGGGASNVECNFTNYARKTLTDADAIATTVDNTANTQYSTLPDLVYTNAGGATNNSVVKALICYDADTTAGTDAAVIPLSAHDVTWTTDGTTVTISDPATGFFSAP